MKNIISFLTLVGMCLCLASCASKKVLLKQYPSTTISNDEVQMKVYLPDAEKGLYRATRFDWSGVIGSVQYKGHEYFGYWKNSHDPLFHEDLTGPVEGYITPGLGYADAEPGGKFIRIGVGVLEKEEEPRYVMRKTYKIVDHGKWTIDQGKDWLAFTHEVKSDIGYAYSYKKIIRLKSNGFTIEHKLRNTGEKAIETDQFNHNFFMIDGQQSGTAFKISFPYAVSTDDDGKGLLEIKDKDLIFTRDLEEGENVFLNLSGYSEQVADHQVSVLNSKSGAGVTFTVDKPLHHMGFWCCRTTLSPENFIWISVAPGEEEEWVSDYTLFVE